MSLNSLEEKRVYYFAFTNLEALHKSYMMHVTNGGLFIPMKEQLEMGQEVELLLMLLDDSEKIRVDTAVVWITPKFAQGNRAMGVGLQFRSKDNIAKTRIENLLAEKLSSDQPTHTM